PGRPGRPDALQPPQPAAQAAAALRRRPHGHGRAARVTRSEEFSELLELAGAVCNGSITPAQHERLQQLLATDPRARQLYFDYLDLHLALDQQAQPTAQLQNVAGPPRRRRRW